MYHLRTGPLRTNRTAPVSNRVQGTLLRCPPRAGGIVLPPAGCLTCRWDGQTLDVEWCPSLRCGFASGSGREGQRLDVEWCPSLRCGFASGSVRVGQWLDVWYRVSMQHMKQRPCDATDTLSLPRNATRVSFTSDYSLPPSIFHQTILYDCMADIWII